MVPRRLSDHGEHCGALNCQQITCLLEKSLIYIVKTKYEGESQYPYPMWLVLLFNLVFPAVRSYACLFLHVPPKRDRVILGDFHVQVGVASFLLPWNQPLPAGVLLSAKVVLDCTTEESAVFTGFVLPLSLCLSTHFRELFPKLLTSTQPIKPPQYCMCSVTEAECRKICSLSWSGSHEMRKMLMNWRRKMPLTQRILGRYDLCQVPGGIPLI